jgi:hypothetical protein
MRNIKTCVLILTIGLILISCSSPPQPSPEPENTATLEPTTDPSDLLEPTDVIEQSFTAGIQFCSLEPNTYPLDHKEPGWNTYKCAFWIQSTLNTDINKFLVFEDEMDDDSKPADLRAHETTEIGLYVTTDAQVNYPVDVIVESYAVNSFLQKGVPITSSLNFQARETKRNLPHSFFFTFNIPESVMADEIVLSNSDARVSVPTTDLYTNTIPSINREVSDQNPEFEQKDSIDIAFEGSSFSYDQDRLYLSMDYLVSNLHKTALQEGSFEGYRIYDPSGYYWYPESDGGNLWYDLSPDRSGTSSLRFSSPYAGIPEILYIIPKGGNSDLAYPLDTKPIEVTNCNPVAMKKLSERWDDIRPEFYPDRLANIGSLDGPGQYEVYIPANYSSLWKLVVDSRELIEITITGNYLENTYFDDLFLPDGKEVSSQMEFSRSESPENNVTISYSFYSLCDGPYYLLDLNNSSTSGRNITLTISGN